MAASRDEEYALVISNDRWEQVKAAFDGALRHAVASREDFLDRACLGDAALKAEAQSLLAAYDAADSLIDHPALRNQWSNDIGGSLQRAGSSTAFGEDDEFRGTSRFVVRRRVGRGGFGGGFECPGRAEALLVGLKLLRRRDSGFLYRFKREFRALVDLRHPNVVELYELFSEDQRWFFTMELIQGVTFLQYVMDGGAHHASPAVTTSVARLRAAARQLAQAIVAVHSAGMLHRDVKPANALVDADGRVRLLDFGLVHEAPLDSLQSVVMAGTPAYMSP